MRPASTTRGSHGAWQKFERGEIPLFPFYEQFGRELSDTAVNNPAYAKYCQRHGLGQSPFLSPFPLLLPFPFPSRLRVPMRPSPERRRIIP